MKFNSTPQGLWKEDQDNLPDTDDTHDVGSSSYRLAEIHSRKAFFTTSGTGGGNFTLTEGGMLAGTASNGGTISSARYGNFAFGDADRGVIAASATVGGALAGGIINPTGTQNNDRIEATANGSFAFGSVGSAASGLLSASKIRATSNGSMAVGFVRSNFNGECKVEASGQGSLAVGNINPGNYKSTLTAETYGTFACGSSYAYYATVDVQAKAFGCFVMGSTYDGDIIAGVSSGSGKGAFAGGYANPGFDVKATGNGSFCWGNATGASILASAENAVQFGPGTNSQALSLKIGGSTGIRINGNGAPSAKQNGDIWVASGYVYIHSNSVDVKIT